MIYRECPYTKDICNKWNCVDCGFYTEEDNSIENEIDEILKEWSHTYSSAAEIYSFNDTISNMADIPAYKVIKFRNALVSTKQDIWNKIDRSDLSSEDVSELYGWSSAIETIINIVDTYLLEVKHEQ